MLKNKQRRCNSLQNLIPYCQLILEFSMKIYCSWVRNIPPQTFYRCHQITLSRQTRWPYMLFQLLHLKMTIHPLSSFFGIIRCAPMFWSKLLALSDCVAQVLIDFVILSIHLRQSLIAAVISIQKKTGLIFTGYTIRRWLAKHFVFAYFLWNLYCTRFCTQCTV